MKSSFEKIGSHIRLVDERDEDLRVKTLLGLTIDKTFIPSVANTIGSDMANYKIVRKGQFACSLMQVRRDKRIPVALLTEIDEAIISPAYPVFEITDTDKLLPEYLMMWFRRPEFDREACFYAVGGVRGSLEWEDFCNMSLPIPTIEKQREIVKEYHAIVDRIRLNEQLNRKLEETAQAIYRHWFVDFEFPISAEDAAAIGKPELAGEPYKSSGGEMVFNEVLKQEIPQEWEVQPLSKLTSKIGSGATPEGGKESYFTSGISLVRSLNVFDYVFEFSGLAFIDEAQAKKLSNVILQEGDVLLNITGVSVARCCLAPKSILPGRVNQHVMIIRPKNGLAISHYLLCLLCSTDYKQKLLGTSESGSTRQALTKSEIESLHVLLPSKIVQEDFESKSRAIFASLDNFTRQNHTLDKLLQNLLSMMATSHAC